MRNVLIALGLLVPALGAQETPPSTPAPAAAAAAPQPADRSADEKAIRDLDAASAKAFDAGDADAYAAFYTEDAVLITEDGERIEGRSAIAEYFTAIFQENPGDKIEFKTEAIRFLGPDTAEEEGRAVVTPADNPAAPDTTRYTVLFVKRDGKWLQARERDEPDRRLTPHDHLKALEWMVGEWVNESPEAVVLTKCHWTDNGNFLLRDFVVKMEGRTVMSGSQRIGWDPLSGDFKSWVFDTDGGFSEGVWTHSGNQWMVKASGVQPDGKIASGTQVVTQLSKDRISWESRDRTLGSEALPDIDEIILVRKPPEPSAPKPAPAATPAR